MNKVILIVSMILLMAAGVTNPQDRNDFSIASLKGLDTVQVYAIVDDDLEKYLSEDRIKTVLELKLMQNGFVLSDDMSSVKARISMNITALENRGYDNDVLSFAISYNLDIDQPTLLSRDYNIYCISTTWSHSGVAIAGTRVVKSHLESIVNDGLDALLRDHLKANMNDRGHR